MVLHRSRSYCVAGRVTRIAPAARRSSLPGRCYDLGMYWQLKPQHRSTLPRAPVSNTQPARSDPHAARPQRRSPCGSVRVAHSKHPSRAGVCAVGGRPASHRSGHAGCPPCGLLDRTERTTRANLVKSRPAGRCRASPRTSRAKIQSKISWRCPSPSCSTAASPPG